MVNMANSERLDKRGWLSPHPLRYTNRSVISLMCVQYLPLPCSPDMINIVDVKFCSTGPIHFAEKNTVKMSCLQLCSLSVGI